MDNLRKHLGRNESNYFLYDERAQSAPPHPSELLHLNQAGVQHLISDLTDAQASTL